MSDQQSRAIESSTRELLRTLDLEQTSERGIRAILAEKLGYSVEQFKPLIAAIIDEYMQSGQARQMSSQEPINGVKHKKQKAEAVGNDDDGEEELRQKWEGSPKVGQGKSALNGFQAKVEKEEEEEARKKNVPWTNKNDDGDEHDDEKKRMKIFDSLEDYGPNGATAKTISDATKIEKSEVNKILYEALKSERDVRLSHDLEQQPPRWILDVTKQVKSSPDITTGVPGSAKAALAKQTTMTNQVPPPVSNEPQGQPAADAVEGEVCRLSASKRVTVSEYRGKTTIGMREYYQKDGKWLPGKKGINLNAEQFESLRETVADVEIKMNVVEAGSSDNEMVAEIGGNKRVTVQKYDGKPMVHVREYYEKDDKFLPGFKGIALLKDQWQILVENVDRISAMIA